MTAEKNYSYVLVLFSALIATFWNYQFGGYDHLEHLPLLFRLEDPSYLSQDVFLNANSEGYDPRYYSSLLLALLHQFLPLPLVYLLLTLGINLIIAGVSNGLGLLLSGGRVWAGRMALILVMSVRTVDWGSVAEMHAFYFTPNILAFSLILWALWRSWQGQWVIAGLLCAMAALVHPLVGPECGGLLFVFAFFRLGFKAERRAYQVYFVGLALFALACVGVLYPYFFSKGEQIEPSLFYEIYVKLRCPHHILPSRFLNPEEWKNGLYLLGILLVLLFQSHRSAEAWRRALDREVLAWVLALSLFAFIGYYFVEHRFVRLIATAQPFRLLYLLKYFSLLYMGVALGTAFEADNRRSRLYAWAGLAASFAWPNFLRLWLWWGFTNLLQRRWVFPSALLALELSLASALGGYGLYKAWETGQYRSDVYPWLALVLLVPVLHSLTKNYRLHYALWALTASVLIGVWWLNPISQPQKPWELALQRRYSLADFSPEILRISAQIERLTPPDAVLLTPPILGEFRYTANRALVVSFKTYPFKGPAMADWRQRMFDCYGWTDMEGFAAVQWSFEPQYRVIDEERLRLIVQKYGADYALLYRETPSTLPLLYEDEHYKLLDLRPLKGEN